MIDEESLRAWTPKEPDNRLVNYGIVAALAVILGLFGIPAVISLIGVSDLDRCDDAIKATLKAPATYKRINGLALPQEGKTTYIMTYEAENSFGVPLSGKGSCEVGDSGELLRWQDDAALR